MSRKNWDTSGLKEALSRGGAKEHGGVVGTRTPSNGARRRDECNRALISEAGSNPAHAPLEYKGQAYKSKGEYIYAVRLDLELRAGVIKAWWYEPFSLWLPGKVRYKPDFMIQYPDGLERKLEIVEVKGWSKNRRDGMTRLKIAAALFPCFALKLATRSNGGWDETYIE